MSNEMHKEKQIRSKKLQITRKDSSKQMPIAEVEKSSNNLNIREMLEVIYNQIYQGQSSIDDGSRRSSSVTSFNEINVEQFQLSAKAFVDQKFSDRKLISKELESPESRPFSDALEILKPKMKTTKYSENVSCHCSLLQSHHRSSSEVANVKSTPFSFSEMKRKLKCSFGRTRKEPSGTLVNVPTFVHSVNSPAKSNDKTRGLKSNSLEVGFAKKREFDVIVEAKRHLSTRLEAMNAIETSTSRKCPKKLGRLLSSPEHDSWVLSPSTEIKNCSVFPQKIKGKQKAYASPSRQSEEATASSDDSMKVNTEVHEKIDFARVDLKTRLDSPSVMSDDPSTPLSTYQPDESTKDREEQPSPISVLDPCFTDDVNSPPSIIVHRRAGRQLQPRRLDYEESSHETSRENSTITTTICRGEKDSISCYVAAVLQASHLNWDELSAIILLTDQLLHESLFDEVELPSIDPPPPVKKILPPPLPPWLSSVNKLKIQFGALEQHVVDEVLKESDFYLLRHTERRTLDQLVGKDVANSGSWLDIRVHIDEIVSQISESLLDELILYLLLDFNS